MTAIKAIETVYNGYRFRSRLEARWAVFFDEFGVHYEYEPEGFDLDGHWYLPDFYLPEINHWVEIKPYLPPTTEAEAKAKFIHNLSVCRYFGEKVGPMILLAGSPGGSYYCPLFFPNPVDSRTGIVAAKDASPSDAEQVQRIYMGLIFMKTSDDIDRYFSSMAAARQARFEHGERPQ